MQGKYLRRTFSGHLTFIRKSILTLGQFILRCLDGSERGSKIILPSKLIAVMELRDDSPKAAT
jgi:hypothetical protein